VEDFDLGVISESLRGQYLTADKDQASFVGGDIAPERREVDLLINVAFERRRNHVWPTAREHQEDSGAPRRSAGPDSDRGPCRRSPAG